MVLEVGAEGEGEVGVALALDAALALDVVLNADVALGVGVPALLNLHRKAL